MHPGYKNRDVLLDEHPVVITVVLPEFFWCASFFLPEETVEIGYIIEPAIISYFCYRLGSVYQQPGCMAQPHFQQTVHESDAGPVFKETAERNIRHICQFGYFR